ncbi:hypothetical protein GW17_00043396 [Ensete ventricosum]|nr:hypothetical protein GW17_00043396 [Ensete ventricosum]
MRGYYEFVASSSFSGEYSLRSELSPCYDLVGLGDRPNLNSVKKARSLSSIRVSKASNLAPIRSTDTMTFLEVGVLLEDGSRGNLDGVLLSDRGGGRRVGGGDAARCDCDRGKKIKNWQRRAQLERKAATVWLAAEKRGKNNGSRVEATGSRGGCWLRRVGTKMQEVQGRRAKRALMVRLGAVTPRFTGGPLAWEQQRRRRRRKGSDWKIATESRGSRDGSDGQ